MNWCNVLTVIFETFEEEMVVQILLSMAVHRHLEKASNFRRKYSSASLEMMP